MTQQQVLHLRSSIGVYGAENVLLGLIPALQALGVGGRLLALQAAGGAEQALLQRAGEQGVPAALLPCRGRIDWQTVRTLRREMAGVAHAAAAPPARPALLHVHDYKSAFYAWLARAGRALPIVATSHGQFNDSGRLHLYHHIERALMRRFEQVCIVSAEMRPGLLASGIAPDRIHLVENGIDTARYHPQVVSLPAAEIGMGPGAFVFGAAMRLAEQKFPLGLIDAFAACAWAPGSAVLVIAGDGPLRADAEARVTELGLRGSVVFLGARKDLDRCYASFDCFVLPSLFEGLPLALLEAMATGCQVVATRVGQVGEVLTGLPAQIIAPNDVPALARAMRAAVDLRADRALSGVALRERVVQRFSVARMAADYAAIYAAADAAA